MPTLANIHFQLYEGSREGQGKTVVLLHGAGGNLLSWPAQVRRMHGCRIYAIDLPGHGKSGGVGRQSIPAYAEAIIQWMAVAGLNEAVLAGHSMGSAIALHLALEGPDTISGLILIGASSQLNVNPSLLEDFSSQTTYMSGVEKTVKWSFCDETPSRVKELVEKSMAETRQGVLFGDFSACSSFDVSNRLGKINKPVLVICGEHDRMTPCRNAQYLADHIENATLRIIPMAGHMTMLEQPDVVAEEMRTFLAGF